LGSVHSTRREEGKVARAATRKKKRLELANASRSMVSLVIPTMFHLSRVVPTPCLPLGFNRRRRWRPRLSRLGVTLVIAAWLAEFPAQDAHAEAPPPNARSFSLDDISGDAQEQVLCWTLPKRIGKADGKRVMRSLTLAAKATAPASVAYKVEQIREPKNDIQEYNCTHVFALSTQGRRASTRITIDGRQVGETPAFLEQSLTANLAKISGTDFEPTWRKIWNKVQAPPTRSETYIAPVAATGTGGVQSTTSAAAEGKGAGISIIGDVAGGTAIAADSSKPALQGTETVSGETYVDQDLAQEQAKMAFEAQEKQRTDPIASFYLGGAFTSRSVSNAPGISDNAASLMGFAGDATLHLSTLTGPGKPHAIDINVGYLYRFATAENSTETFGVTSDRFNADARYRYALEGAYLPAVGGVLGYELLRFQVDEAANALSVTYSAIRVGPTVQQPLYKTDTFEARLFVEGALRFVPGADGGEASLGFDVSGGPEVKIFEGLLARLLVRYTQHGGTVSGADFTDSYLDVGLSVGWQL
jgi:hypothetical protein